LGVLSATVAATQRDIGYVGSRRNQIETGSGNSGWEFYRLPSYLGRAGAERKP